MKILICGLGSIGTRHYNILKKLDENIEFFALRSQKHSRVSSDNKITEVYDIKDTEQLKLDAILITNPTSLHISTANYFVKRGLPLFIEKPLGHSLEGVDELRRLSIKNGTAILIGNNLIYHPAIEKIAKLLKENAIGKVICSRVQFGTFMPNWHPAENYKESYASRKDLGGGVVLTSIHELNYLTYLFGDVDKHMAMEIDQKVLDIEVEEGIEILLKHQSRMVSNIHLNFFQKPNHRCCEIMGTEGTLLWDFWKSEIEIRTQDSTKVIDLGMDARGLLNKSYEEQMKHFLDVVRNKIEPKVDLDKGIRDLTISLEILKSIGR